MHRPCRACSQATEVFLAFGDLPLGNALVAADVPPEAQDRFPLTMTLCSHCHLVQLAEVVDPSRLFGNYVYLSSNSPAFVKHAMQLAQRMIAERSLGQSSQIIEIASNDGYLLQAYRARGIRVLGIEPAANVAEIARQNGIETLCEFFGADLARKLSTQRHCADVIHANNVLAHVPDLCGFVAGLGAILKPDGVVVIEVPYLRDLVDNLEFDTVYHEHQCYFALAPLVSLFAGAGLQIFDVEHIAVHGGSLRLFARHANREKVSAAVVRLLEEERAWGVDDIATYRRFAQAVGTFPRALRTYLQELRAAGKSIAAYGASAKGTTLLNYCGVDRALIDFVVDRSPLKQGLTMPGVRIPILPTEELLNRQPDFVLLLAWNFVDEVVEQQSEYGRRGGRFILPVPVPRVAPACSPSSNP